MSLEKKVLLPASLLCCDISKSNCSQNNDQQTSSTNDVAYNQDTLSKRRKLCDVEEPLDAPSSDEAVERSYSSHEIKNENIVAKRRKLHDENESKLRGKEALDLSFTNCSLNNEDIVTERGKHFDETESKLDTEEFPVIQSSDELIEASSTSCAGNKKDNISKEEAFCDETEGKLQAGELSDTQSNEESIERNFVKFAVDKEDTIIKQKELHNKRGNTKLEVETAMDLCFTNCSLNNEGIVSKREEIFDDKENKHEEGGPLDIQSSNKSIEMSLVNCAISKEGIVTKQKEHYDETKNKLKEGELLKLKVINESSVEPTYDSKINGIAPKLCSCLQDQINEDSKSPKTMRISNINDQILRKTNKNKENIKREDEQFQYDITEPGKNDSLICDSNLCDEKKKNDIRTGTKEREKTVSVSLIPEKRSILSDYNLMLVENIKLFDIPTAYNICDGAYNVRINDLPASRVGLRCIHCPPHGRHVTAASFFPSSIASIASGIGTIGARHFVGGKCPYLSSNMVERLKQNKKISQLQTRMQGKIGLDAYCRAFAKRTSINNLKSGGIQFSSSTKEVALSLTQENGETTQKIITKLNEGKKPSSQTRSLNVDVKDSSAFIEGVVENFWECKYCNSLPYHWRASGSVIFSAEAPTFQQVEKHLSNCQGNKPLRIPRNATIQTKEGEDSTLVIIQWDQQDKSVRKSGRIQRRLLANGNSKRKTHSSSTSLRVNENIENEILVLPQEKSLTTDFAYFTVMQLKKCYLTKAGGSRGNCPLGYPGLACSHCAGTPTARRFFYTSADHLRNSFSHIPSHLAVCTKCPDNVKQRLEEFKETRNRQKSLLRCGEHKQFIDQLWERLHGPNGGMIDSLQDETSGKDGEASDDDSSTSSVSLGFQADSQEYRRLSTSTVELESDHISIEPIHSDLLFHDERRDVSDYSYYTILQMIPMLIKQDQNQCVKTESEEKKLKKEKTLDLKHGSVSAKQDQSMQGKVVDIQKDQSIKKNFTIVCRHCAQDCKQKQFFPRSADELRKKFKEIPKHLFLCSKCPDEVKAKLRKLKSLRASQEAYLRRGAQQKFINLVWTRLERHFTQSSPPTTLHSAPHRNVVNSIALVTENDRKLVTQFTFFTMEQMKRCLLDKSGNGSRSMFQHGFPGLSCIHCSDTPSARKFFYRTSDILSGNYAHIPNHVLSCRHCPLHIKQTLARMKRNHADEKMKLHRGSQRIFFNNVWDRLHGRQK